MSTKGWKPRGTVIAVFLLGCVSGTNGGFNSAGTGSNADTDSGIGNDGSGAGSGGGVAGDSSGAGDGSARTVLGTTSGGASSGMSSSGVSPSPGTDAALGSSPRDAGGLDAASTSNSDSGDPLNSVRQACVDTINMYRATINVAPLARASASTEACSDLGAMEDATSGTAHGSAGMCPGTGAQDTCPELPVGGGATLLSSLKQCLAQMWDEGPPPSGTTVAQCIQDYSGCFLQHGHWINMSDSYMTQTAVSCGFYQMPSGDYWSNQDFLP
jgi:hypothetical protein